MAEGQDVVMKEEKKEEEKKEEEKKEEEKKEEKEEEKGKEEEKKEEKEENKEEKKEEKKEEGGQQQQQQPQEIRIVVDGLPKFWNPKSFTKFLTKNNISKYLKSKKIPNKTVAVMTFENQEDKEAAMKALVCLEVQNRKLKVEEKQRPNYNDNQRKRKREDEDGGQPRKRMNIEDVVTPLHNLPYNEQLKKKSGDMLQIMRQIIPRTKRNSRYNTPQWLKKRVNIEDVAPFHGIIPTPDVGYRNKIQFAIATEEGKPMVGYTQGQQRLDNLQICDPKDCKNTPKEAIVVREIIQEYLASSALPPYDLSKNEGFWRQVTVRCTANPHQLMVVIQVSPKDLPPQTVEEEKKKLTDALVEKKKIADSLPDSSEPSESSESSESSGSGSGSDIRLMRILKSVIFQDFDGLSVAPENLESDVRFGSDVIFETVMGLEFRVSANSFFQVNSYGAECLLQLVSDWAADSANEEPKDEEMKEEKKEEEKKEEEKKEEEKKEEGKGKKKRVDVVDVCCGTGTIGLCLSRMADKVIGVEMCADAVEDAKFNAKHNNIENCEFQVGKAEDVLSGLLSRYRTKEGEKNETNLVGVVDPPRSGLHKSVVKSIRECSVIKHLIYVSCNQKSMLDNAADLCRGTSSHLTGAPFRPVCAVSVDLFPHTPHAELVVLFERLENEQVELGPPQVKARIPPAAVFPFPPPQE